MRSLLWRPWPRWWATAGGWTPTLARLYYVCGATLVVGWLGLGTWLLLVQRPWLRN
ncbi:MAG: hypothetical protein R2911_41335 [Caldilineaceae bacterium]